MVVFTCGHCGESVQKPKVDKHYQTKCRNRNPNLSCMDCFKDFYGNDYEAHTKCITEEQRYSGKGYVAKEKKGEKKQNAWVEMLQSVLDEQKSASGNVRRILETISKHTNTPRKKPKFINFVKNVCGQKTNPKDIDQAWDMISGKLGELANLNAQNRNENKQNDKPNGKLDETIENKENGDVKDESEIISTKENDNEVDEAKVNGNNDEEKENKTTKKLSKKQRKEEKKRQKYESELKSVEEPVDEEAVVNDIGKKGKKKKNKSESQSDDAGVVEEGKGKNKNKKRKRQDTVNSVHDPKEAIPEPVLDPKVDVGKINQKKKLKVDEEEDEGICLHDQNVAKAEESDDKKDKFNWHSVIISVLQKKDNEIAFKRLQKKVLGEYSEYTGQEVDDRIAEKFIKKLKSAPNVRVVKNTVHLIE